MSYVAGVDLGTTYTAAAILRDGRVTVVELGDRVASVASVLWFRDDHGLVVGEAAVRRAESAPGRVAREFKRRFGDPVPVMVGGTPIAADALMARLLRWVVDTVTEQQGGEPVIVGVTHPANWGPYKLDLLAQAVRLAGVDHATFLSEPYAAAESHATGTRVAAGDVVAVYDLGGGTFDAAVLQRRDSDFELLGAEGIERLGGIDLDEAVFGHVREVVGPGLTGLDQADPVVAGALLRVRNDCAQAKEALSSDTEVSVPVALPGVYTTVRLCRGEFEEMIRPIVASTVGTLSRAITSAGLTPAQVSKVLLVGGSSRIPLVSLMIRAELGCPVAMDTQPKHAVAMGAAHLAGRETPKSRGFTGAMAGRSRVSAGAEAAPCRSSGRQRPRFRKLIIAVIVITILILLFSMSTDSDIAVGAGPDAAALSPDGRHAYIIGVSSVSVINTESDTVTDIIPVEGILGGVAVAPDGRHAYFTNSGSVSVIDTASNTVTRTIPVDDAVRDVAVAPDGRHAYITSNPGGTDYDNSGLVSVLDTVSNTVTRTIPVGEEPGDLALSPDGRYAYVTSSGSVSVIDTGSNTVTGTIPVGDIPGGVVVSPDGRRAYVTTVSSVLVIDTDSNSVTGTIPVEYEASDVAVSPDGLRAYVTSFNNGGESGSVSVIDTGSNSVVRTILVEKGPRGIAVVPDGRYAYVTKYRSDSVSVIDTESS